MHLWFEIIPPGRKLPTRFGGSNRSSYSAEDEGKIRQLWLEGKTASQIRAYFPGRTREAICGKLDRMGLHRDEPGRERVTPGPQPRPKQAKPVKAKQPERKVKAQPRKLLFELNRHEATDLLADQSPCEVTFLELNDSTCRWPLGEPKDFRYCGDKPIKGYPYCARHCRKAYRLLGDDG